MLRDFVDDEASDFLGDADDAQRSFELVTPDTIQIKLSPSKKDEEQVSAASNLLEFHNQNKHMLPTHILSDLPCEEDIKVDVKDLIITPDLDNSAVTSERFRSIPRSVIPPLRGYGRKPLNGPGKILPPINDPNLKQKTTVDPPSSSSPVKKKRRLLLIDTLKVIPNSEFKQQLQDTSDIVGKSDYAPHTKKAMHQLTFGGVGKYFAYPGRKILSGRLAQIFLSHLTVRTQSLPVQNGELEPLNSELRTTHNGAQSEVYALYSDFEEYGQLSKTFSETLARRTANSFDQIVKGFAISKSKRVRTLNRRKQTLAIREFDLGIPKTEEVFIKSEYDEGEFSPVPNQDDGLITSDPLATDTGDLEYPAIPKTEALDPEENEMFYFNGNENDSHSKIEMLLAAAGKGVSNAQNNSLGISSPILSTEFGDLQVQSTGDGTDVDSKQILFCTAEREEDGSFVIVDANGKRYSVAPHSSGFTLWSDSAKASD